MKLIGDSFRFRHEFRQNEVVLTMSSVNLETRSTTSGRRDFIAVGTATCRGEDLAVKGGVSECIRSS
jgi:cleavage and polyadenylation specificity factor subunit 1